MIRIFAILFFLFLSACVPNVEIESAFQTEPRSFKGMKKLAMIGGTSWHSTIDYYKEINLSINQHFGNNTNPPLSIFTLDQSEVHRFQKENKWDSIAYMFIDAGLRLEAGGAESLLFCANTPHKIYDQVDSKLNIPIIHIADATAKAIQKENISKVAFIGTKFSMREDFIVGRIKSNGIQVIVPQETATIEELQRIIIEELTYGDIVDSSKAFVLEVLSKIIEDGAEGVVLGCTEFPLMIKPEDLQLPVFNTSEIHANAAVDFILGRE